MKAGCRRMLYLACFVTVILFGLTQKKKKTTDRFPV